MRRSIEKNMLQNTIFKLKHRTLGLIYQPADRPEKHLFDQFTQCVFFIDYYAKHSCLLYLVLLEVKLQISFQWYFLISGSEQKHFYLTRLTNSWSGSVLTPYNSFLTKLFWLLEAFIECMIHLYFAWFFSLSLTYVILGK